jgi:4-amino-4-deoxy-L-arabinose transferase-like glycosyltransferase
MDRTNILRLNKGYLPLVFFCIVTVLIRFQSFFPSVINHDESTYIVIAKELLRGEVLYVDIIDVKPIGIFIIMAVIQLIFGNSIFFVRLCTSLVIALTSFVLYRAKLKIGAEKRTALAAGFIYIFMLSIYTFYGVSVNTEIYFNLFTVSGLLFFLNRKNQINLFIAGIFLGFGFVIKYVVLFDLLAFLTFHFILSVRESKPAFFKIILKVCIPVIGFIIPFGAVNLYYLLIGHYKEFFFHTIELSRNYPVQRDLMSIIRFIMDFHVRFLPVTLFFYYCLFDQSVKTANIRFERLLVIIWVLFDLFAILYPGKPFGHYFIQLILPFSFFAGNFFVSGRKLPFVLRKAISKPVGFILIIILIVIILFTQKKDYIDKPDYPREIAEFLAPRLNESDVIYTGNYHHIIYFLLDKNSPAKYVHRTLIRADHHIKALQINTDAEIERIIKAEPRFVINKGAVGYEKLQDYINKNYILLKTFNKDIYVYEKVIPGNLH